MGSVNQQARCYSADSGETETLGLVRSEAEKRLFTSTIMIRIITCVEDEL